MKEQKFDFSDAFESLFDLNSKSGIEFKDIIDISIYTAAAKRCNLIDEVDIRLEYDPLDKKLSVFGNIHSLYKFGQFTIIEGLKIK